MPGLSSNRARDTVEGVISLAERSLEASETLRVDFSSDSEIFFWNQPLPTVLDKAITTWQRGKESNCMSHA
jgi:hypothetical protein